MKIFFISPTQKLEWEICQKHIEDRGKELEPKMGNYPRFYKQQY